MMSSPGGLNALLLWRSPLPSTPGFPIWLKSRHRDALWVGAEAGASSLGERFSPTCREGKVEPFRIEMAAAPALRLAVFGMVRIIDHLEELLIAANSADILGRPSSRAAQAARALGRYILRQQVQLHPVAPVISEVVGIDEANAIIPAEVSQPNLGLIEHASVQLACQLVARLRIAIAEATDLERVQVADQLKAACRTRWRRPKVQSIGTTSRLQITGSMSSSCTRIWRALGVLKSMGEAVAARGQNAQHRAGSSLMFLQPGRSS